MTEQTPGGWRKKAYRPYDDDERFVRWYIMEDGRDEHDIVAEFVSERDADRILADHDAARKLELAVAALRSVLDHLDELADAWQRGVLSEADKMGGWRANRNAEYAHVLRRTLAEIKGRE